LCLANYFTDPVFRAGLTAPPEGDLRVATDLWAMLFGNPALTWDDVAWLRSLTRLPLLLKGICSPHDVLKAVDTGVGGICCSNHGGRQANGGLPALDCLPDVVDATGDLPVIFDSGVRNGADVVKVFARRDRPNHGDRRLSGRRRPDP
jgi:lactate 2-monooxygenase